MQTLNSDCQVLHIFPQIGDADQSGTAPELLTFSRVKVRRSARAVAGSVRIETAKFSKPCPKGRTRYYLRRSADAGSIPGSTTNVRKTNHSRLVFSSPRVGAGLAIGYVVSRLHSPHFPILRALSVSVFLHLSVDCFKGDLLA